MASITREKVQKINEGAKNNFKLDIQYYLIWKEYTLEKLQLIEGTENKYNNFRLGYREHKEIKTNEWGCSYPVYTGTYDIVLNYNTSLYENKMLITNGLGKNVIIETGLTRKSVKDLQKATEKLTDEFLGGVINE